MKKLIMLAVVWSGLGANGFEKHDELIRLKQLYDYNPHLLTDSDLQTLRAASGTFSTNSSLTLNGFGRAVVFSPNTASQTLMVTGYGFLYNPNISPQTQSGVQTAASVQTAYAMLCMARYFYAGAQDGQPDTSFNPLARGITGTPGAGFVGQVITDFGSNTFPMKLVIQPATAYANQKIIVVGYAYVVTTSSVTSQYTVFTARYNWDGSLDTTFNPTGATPGVVTTMVSAIPAQPNLISAIVDQGFAVALQSDNKIVVTGSASGQLFVIRYNTNGSLDSTFNPTGSTYNFNRLPAVGLPGTTTPGIFLCSILGTRSVSSTGLALVGYDCGYGIVVQPDGKIVVAGTGSSFIPPSSLALTSSTAANNATAASVSTNFNAIGNNQIIVLRLNTNGTPDTTFGQVTGSGASSGVQVTTIAGFDDRCYAVALQPDGKIVTSGTSLKTTGGFYDMNLVRYTTAGLVDTSFGLVGQTINGSTGSRLSLSGKVILDVANGAPYSASYAVVVQPDGKILTAGYNSYTPSSPRFTFVVARYTTSGNLDKTFNPGGYPQGVNSPISPLALGFGVQLQPGVQTISIQGIYDQSYGMALQPDGSGKVVLVGSSYDTNPLLQLYAFAAVRLLANASIDTSITATFTNQ